MRALLFVAIGVGAIAVPRAESLPACIAVRGEARYVPYGYNHVVVLTSSCTKDAICSVASDVNPQPTTVTVPIGGTVEVTTFMGSPASQFKPVVACHLR